MIHLSKIHEKISLYSRDGVKLMDLVDGIDIGSSPQVDILGQSSFDNLIGCWRHDLFQASIHDVQFSCTFQKLRSVESLLRESGGLDNYIDQVLLGLFLPFSGHSTRTHVVEVLEPFEVTDRDSSCVAENVGQELNALFEQDLFSFKSSGAIRGFNNQLCFEPVGILDVDRLLQCCRNEEITK